MKVRRRVATRSALALARKALAVGSVALPAYASPFSRKDFTQAQLFAMLCLKEFLRQDYRGMVALLKDWSDLRRVLRLTKVPHYSTLCYAQARLATRSGFNRLLAAIADDAFAQGLADEPPEVAVDATGFESRHCSRYFVQRRGERGHLWQRWPKLTLACHTQSHLIVGALATIGPSQDSPQFAPVVRQAAHHLCYIDRLLADAGDDGEHNHALARLATRRAQHRHCLKPPWHWTPLAQNPLPPPDEAALPPPQIPPALAGGERHLTN
jgi:Transposase DDE domain